MPPPMPNPSKRMTANPSRPARYRPGKVTQQESSDEDQDEEEEERTSRPQQRKTAPRPQHQRLRVQAKQEDEDEDDEEGFVTDEDEDTGSKSAPLATKSQPKHDTVLASQKTQPANLPQKTQTQSEEESEEEESEEEEEDDEEEESSSEEETPQRRFQRPTFIRKSERKDTNGISTRTPDTADNASITRASSEVNVDEQARRLAQADLLIKDRIERDNLARLQGRKAWDDDNDEILDPEQLVDDTDGVDPAAEHAAWKLRELHRLKRDRLALEAREAEIEELERRRNLTVAEREAEDAAYLEKQKDERDETRGKANFMARYHHKGAFFQDDEAAEFLKKRDIMGAKFVDEVSDKSALPEYMRIRDMTKLGKKGRTRYTDLKGEDTGRFGEDVKRWRGAGDDRFRANAGGINLNGVDERFLPDRDGGRSGEQGPTGANAAAVGERKERRRYDRSRSPRRDRDGDRGDSYGPRRSRSRSRSRSDSPPSRRKRSLSPRRDDRDKRRRVNV